MEQNIITSADYEAMENAEQPDVAEQQVPEGDLPPMQDEPSQQPDVTDTEPEPEQAKQPKPSKDEKKEYAFEEIRKDRDAKDKRLKELEEQQAQVDAYYADLAAQAGQPHIKTEAQYREALAKQNKRKTAINLIMEAEGLDERQAAAKYDYQQLITPTPIPQQPQPEKPKVDPVIDTMAKDIETKDVNEFNDKFEAVIGKSISSWAEIKTLPNSDRILAYMERNLSLSEAFTLANNDLISKRKEEAARQHALNLAKGYEHVKTPKGAAESNTPTASEAEIDEWINEYHYPANSRAEVKQAIIQAKKQGIM